PRQAGPRGVAEELTPGPHTAQAFVAGAARYQSGAMLSSWWGRCCRGGGRKDVQRESDMEANFDTIHGADSSHTQSIGQMMVRGADSPSWLCTTRRRLLG